MSAPPRGSHGGGTATGRSTPPPGSRGRGAARGSASGQIRGRGARGRSALSSTNPKAESLLQGLQTGSLNKRGSLGNAQPGKGRSSTPRGPSRSTRGRGAMASSGNTPSVQPLKNAVHTNRSHKDFMTEMTTKFQDLKQRREGERARAIREGFLADPERKTSLDKAITPVGTCTEMCPEFERVERIVQNMVEKPEKVTNESTGRDMPAEERMVKRFRRSAAGYDEQLPSDIRTPATLQATLNYLLNDVINGGEHLAAIHKFVWDRTRGIRNDFSIQQVSKDEDVKFAVDCFERIARFHILSLHQLSNPENVTSDSFDAHQEREQLNNTLLSLMYYYDDNRHEQTFPNEAEFRAYCIVFELQSSHPDLEDRMQSWPPQLLNDTRVQTAFRLYSAATNTLFEQGPLKPTAPFSIAQGNAGAFWKLLKSKAVSYTMSCVAEIHFGQIRYMALQNLWESHKGPSVQQIRNQEWTLDGLTDALAFDNGQETLEFCQGYGLEFKTSTDGTQHLGFTSQPSSLDQSSTPSKQVFSHSIVEAKRYNRSLVAVINGVGVARAIREGLIEADPQQDAVLSNTMEESSKEGLFFPETRTPLSFTGDKKPASTFNPEAPTFTPNAAFQPTWPSSTSSFGKPSAITPFAPVTSTSSAPMSTVPSGSSLPSFLPTSSTISSSAFGQGPISFINSFTPEPHPPGSPSSTPTPIATPSTLSDFKFGQTTSTTSPQLSTSSRLSFNKPSTTPFSFNQPSGLQQQQGQHQPSRPENHSDAPIFVPRFPGSSIPTAFSPAPLDETREAVLPSRSEDEGLRGTRWLDANQQPQELREPVRDPQSVPQEAIHSQAVPQRKLEETNGEAIPTNPPSSPRPAQLELSGDFATPLPPFPPSKTGSNFSFESPFAASSSGQAMPPRITQANASQSPTTAVFAPRPPPSSDSTSRSSLTTPNSPNTVQPSFSWTTPAPLVVDVADHPIPTQPTSPSLLPSQYPAPSVQPRPRKPTQPKVKELKAVSPHDPTPRDSSPLRERPVIFGDNTNAFRQSAAYGKPPPPPKRTISVNDRAAAVETVARLALLQPAGLMQEYLQFTLPYILKPCVQQHEREKPILAAKTARRQILAKKYFTRWRAYTYRRAINRRARERRQLRIGAGEKEKQKRMRGEAELEAILQAKNEKERMQAEVLARRAIEPSPAVQNGVHQTAGQKRKSIHVDRAEDSVSNDSSNPRKIVKGHRRSRTMGHADDLFNSSRSTTTHAFPSTTAPQSRSSIFISPAFLNGSRASPEVRRSLSGRKDTTRTDYFRLKALGIDPDTPIIPDTKASLVRRRQREEEIATAVGGTRGSTLSSISRPPVLELSPHETTTYRTFGTGQSWTSANAKAEATISAATESNDDDDLLRQIRDVRKAMKEGTEWFRKEAVSIEKDIEVQKELRRSASQASSRSSPHPPATGFARANGYAYLPGPEISGHNLSRTEQRIRRTGAHGLATKPIGGSGQYLAVAMSRDSAAKWNMEKRSERASNIPNATGKSRNRRRKIGEKDTRYIPQHSDEDSEEPENEAKPERLPRYQEPCTNGKVRAGKATGYLQEQDEISEVYTDVEEDNGDDVQQSLGQPRYQRHDGLEGGDTEDLYEDGDDEEELYEEDEQGKEEYEEEAEEEEQQADEVGSLPDQQVQKRQGQTVGYWLRSSVTPERGLTPNGGPQMMSRVSSEIGTGTGASADDAFILDSD